MELIIIDSNINIIEISINDIVDFFLMYRDIHIRDSIERIEVSILPMLP